jgi:ABC-type Fe3+ transport system permease subunit
MKRVLRRLARIGAIGVMTLLGLPIVLLVPAALFDRGPSGEVRSSLFPFALAVWDPFVWVSARNSLIVAAIVTSGSLVLGVALARVIGPWRWWGRRPLALLAWLPLALPPAFAAVGIVRVIPPIALGRRLARATGHALLFDLPWDVWIGWGLLVWVGIAAATPIVALSVKAALGRVDPAWSDAGRALGASRRRAWRSLVWPIVRPETARTLAAVFGAALFEPGAPLVLGLRRTLGYQMVEAVSRVETAPRAAVLALLGLALAVIGRLLIRGWGGPRIDIDPRERFDRPSQSSWPRGLLSALGLSAWVAFGVAPLLGLCGIVVGANDPHSGGGGIVAAASVVYRLIDPDTARLWFNALGLALGVTLVDAAILAGLARPLDPSRRRVPRPSLFILGFERTPALVLGVAAALAPGVLSLAADCLGVSPLHRLATLLDPIRWPGLLLIAATAATRLSTLARASDRAELNARPSLSDAAITLGASRRRAARLGGGRGPGRGILVLTFALAATSVTPALVLEPTARTRTVGPGIVELSYDPEKAAGLALGAAMLNLIGLASARRTRSGPAGDWFRG